MGLFELGVVIVADGGGSGVPGGWYRSIRSGGMWVSWGWVVTGVRGRVNPG